MYILQLYIEGQRVELFEDETVVLNSSIQNIRDISKVFTDFTQTFNVPASDKNNLIFEHWHNADITSGFNAKVRKQAKLELSNLPFKDGRIQLEGVQMKDGKPYSYRITFFGNLVKLTDLFGEDELSDLDLSAYDHDYTSANVLQGIRTETLKSGNVIYPLISSERNWVWDAQSTALADDDIKYTIADDSAINYGELKPALRVNRIIEAIETDYGITFSSDFFKNASIPFNELYLWLSSKKGNIERYSDAQVVFNNINWNSTMFNYFSFSVTPETGYNTVPYKVIVENTSCGDQREFEFTGATTSTPPWAGVPIMGGLCSIVGAGIYSISISAQSEFKFQATYSIPLQGDNGSSGVTTITNGNASVANNIPKIKIIDFLGGLIKMFNLVIEPTSFTSFNVIPLDDWYAQGSVLDLTNHDNTYIDISQHDIKRPDLYRQINFKYVEGDTILNTQFRETNGVGYGDLESEFVYDGGILDIDIPFENLMQERLPSQLTNDTSQIQVGKVIDEDLNPVEAAPILFFKKGIVTVTDGFGFSDEDLDVVEVDSYWQTGQEDKVLNADITESLNFGSEINSYTYSVPPVNPNSDSSLVYSLYSNYWEDYITDLYDNKRREYTFKAIIPLGVIIKIKLNDLVIIRDRLYLINNLQTNLTTGEVELKLLNAIGNLATGTPIEDSPIGFAYTFDFDIH